MRRAEGMEEAIGIRRWGTVGRSKGDDPAEEEHNSKSWLVSSKFEASLGQMSQGGVRQSRNVEAKTKTPRITFAKLKTTT